ncbi:uncharacterized protein B0I36DRAFT_30826 [Microdochium trichocladiopsis]|uniref:Uncharacterized protein n=1 Tax=Microdochium trichocladiopsis TaxID=1682393 RepID=A0A9P8XW50_9PEZI|nr:uncharacterized protein B0I36DRAFT_30826 [Microdochium trichocladiopsis]KAH7021273.1 hypothetical protein B0I36DRAFT_30826 [Microdochium trichocladiopsis]
MNFTPYNAGGLAGVLGSGLAWSVLARTRCKPWTARGRRKVWMFVNWLLKFIKQGVFHKMPRVCHSPIMMPRKHMVYIISQYGHGSTLFEVHLLPRGPAVSARSSTPLSCYHVYAPKTGTGSLRRRDQIIMQCNSKGNAKQRSELRPSNGKMRFQSKPDGQQTGAMGERMGYAQPGRGQATFFLALISLA